jgi:hypothetical protein
VHRAEIRRIVPTARISPSTKPISTTVDNFTSVVTTLAPGAASSAACIEQMPAGGVVVAASSFSLSRP